MRKKINYALLVFFLFLFSATGKGTNENKQKVQLDEKVSLNLVCTPKEQFRATILADFSLASVYNPDKVRIWHGSPSKFIPTDIRKDEKGVEIMKGAMFGATRRQSRVEFKNSSKYTYDIYTPKNEWNCIANTSEL